jgi:MarR family transcriptional regulator, lower aerobic nicotinate degradation pathway regulator
MSIMSGMEGPAEQPGFERGTGFLLARLGSLAARSWQAFLAGHGLTQVQYATLMVLGERGPLGQRALAELIAVDARNLVAVLDRLAERGLIAREIDTADRRRRNVGLTPAGTAAMRALAADAAATREEFLGALSRRERRQLNLLLQRLYTGHARQPPATQAAGG